MSRVHEEVFPSVVVVGIRACHAIPRPAASTVQCRDVLLLITSPSSCSLFLVVLLIGVNPRTVRCSRRSMETGTGFFFFLEGGETSCQFDIPCHRLSVC